MYERMAVITGIIVLMLGLDALGEATSNNTSSVGNSSRDTETLKGT
jgi:hypothetical protein